VSTAQGLTDTLDEFNRVLGRRRLGSLHLNDSMTGLGSNRDRHALIGQGELGDRGCAAFLSEPRFERLPVVLETKPSLEQVQLCRKLRKRGQAARRRRTAGAGKTATSRNAAR
jgi:deoxyribonuclease IV